MKNLKQLFLLLVLMSMSGTKASAYDFSAENDDGVTIYYNILSNYDDWRVEVTNGDDCYSGNLILPSTVTYYGTQYKVTKISGNAFNCSPSGLTSIVIPSSVTDIDGYTFCSCNNLASIIVSENNPVYDSRDNCDAVIGKESNFLVCGCKNTTIPNSVVGIGHAAFYYCSGLTSIEIPNSVVYISSQAFEHSGLTSITIPSSVTSIESNPFSGCSPLESIIVDSNNPKYDSRDNCNAIIETESNNLLEGCKNTVIPNTVTSIGNEAFYQCFSLTSIEIPNSVTTIGYEAFDGTSWYNNQPNGLVYAGKVAYKYKGTMPSGTNIVLEEGTVGIAGYAFSNCTGLTEIEIPNSVTNIGRYAFNNCTGLTEIEIPNSVTNISYGTFSGCI